jgi:hypothetical protein
MPKAVVIDDFRTPGSYANFLICNAGVIVPVFNNPNDQVAIDILEKAFPGRKIIPLLATEIIWGQGSFHCLSQQEPLFNSTKSLYFSYCLSKPVPWHIRSVFALQCKTVDRKFFGPGR